MAPSTSQQLLTQIAEASCMPVDAVNEQMGIEELNLDSLELADLLVSLDIPYEAISELHTVGDIATYVSNRKVG